METVTGVSTQRVGDLLHAHPDNIKVAKEVAKGAGVSPFELALRRASGGDYSMATDALAASGVEDNIKYPVMALAYEKAAEIAERRAPESEDFQKGIELRNKSNLFREASLKVESA